MTTAARSNGVGLGVGGGAEEAAVLERGGASADHGRPVCSEMWPGDTADVTTLIPVIDRLRRRFDIARVCVGCEFRGNPARD